jgi:hypothetical protein
MKRILLGSIAAATLAAATVAIAQPAPPVAPAPGVQPAVPGSPLRIVQPQTRNGVVEKVRAHFARLDTDRDGYLTKAEAEAGRAAIKAHRGQWSGRGAGGQRDQGAMFERLDANRDGAISRQEFDTAHQQRQAMRDRDGDGQPDKRMHAMRGHGGMHLGGQMFEQADLNRDSRVSLQEATEAAVRHFDMADVNRDGTLAPEERQQMRVRMKEMHRVTRPS